MKVWICMFLACTWVLSPQGQSTSQEYQPATITAVAPHNDLEKAAEDKVPQYEVTLKLGQEIYVVLYEPPLHSNTVEYTVGQDMLVKVGEKTLTFTKAGISNPTHEVPILRREALPPQTGIDWSRARTDYYSQKLKHLSEKLNLTPEQQTKIKPILEQESGEVAQITFNPVLSDKTKLKQFESTVRASDEKLKPILTPEQLQKLLDMRVQQKQELKQQLEKSKG